MARAKVCFSARSPRGVRRRAQRPARGADSQSVLRGLCGRRDRGGLRAGLSAGDAPDRLPARSRCARRGAAGTHRRDVSRLAVQSAGRGRRLGLSAARDRAGAAASAFWCSATNATGKSTPERAPPGMLEAAGTGSKTSSCSIRCRSARTCRDCASASPPATAASSRNFSNCATSRRRRCRSRCSTSPSPPMRTRPMSRRTAGSIGRSSISPTRSSATATAIAGRPAASSCGSTWRRRAAARPRPSKLVARRRRARRARPLLGPRPGRRQQSGRRLYPRRHGAGQRDHGGGAAPPRRGAWLIMVRY